MIAAILLASFAARAAVVYKWTDTDGVIHFSDQPVPGAEKIVTSAAASTGTTSASFNAPSMGPRPPAGTSVTRPVVAIDSPSKEQVFFNDEAVAVRLHVEPGLTPTQSVSWNLNGQQLTDQAPNAVSFLLQTLPRGTYVLAATVTDSATGTSQSADSVTFYVRQPSELSPQHKKS